MARKLDLSGVKPFLLAKGEKIGVAACVAIAGVLVTYGVMNGMNAQHAPNTGNKTYPQAYQDNLQKARRILDTMSPILDRLRPWRALALLTAQASDACLAKS